jgi:hypothetical protein
LIARAAALAQRHDVYLLVGLGVLTRREPYLRNEAILVDPAGQVVWTYDKACCIACMDHSRRWSPTSPRGASALSMPMVGDVFGWLSVAALAVLIGSTRLVHRSARRILRSLRRPGLRSRRRAHQIEDPMMAVALGEYVRELERRRRSAHGGGTLRE